MREIKFMDVGGMWDARQDRKFLMMPLNFGLGEGLRR